MAGRRGPRYGTTLMRLSTVATPGAAHAARCASSFSIQDRTLTGTAASAFARPQSFPLHLSVGEMHVGGERKFTGMLHDLTKRVRSKNSFAASEARWRSIIESAVDGVVVIDQHGRIEAFNPAAERLCGYPESEVTGRNVYILMPLPYQDEHDSYLSRYLATGKPKIIGGGREVKRRGKDGTTFPLHLSVGQTTHGGEQKFTGILHDLTARVALEVQLREPRCLLPDRIQRQRLWYSVR
jgi:PAS domain S-box-containing protein